MDTDSIVGETIDDGGAVRDGLTGTILIRRHDFDHPNIAFAGMAAVWASVGEIWLYRSILVPSIGSETSSLSMS